MKQRLLPAGGACFDLGGEIIMGAEDMLTVSGITKDMIIANHLEALDHCPVTREQLITLRDKQGLGERLRVPDDGGRLCYRLRRLTEANLMFLERPR